MTTLEALYADYFWYADVFSGRADMRARYLAKRRELAVEIEAVLTSQARRSA